MLRKCQHHAPDEFLIIWTTMERHASANVVHVVTWNVNDNSKMKAGYSHSAMDKVIVILIVFKACFYCELA